MIGWSRRHYMRRLLAFVLSLALLVFFCEYIVYYLAIIQCSWPPITVRDRTALKIMVLADPHLVGIYRGHFLDRMRRDWEMTRAFQAATFLHAPDVVLVLGDLFDEGLWTDNAEFERQLMRYHRIFAHDRSKVVLKNVVGNHDIGFHYAIHPYLDWRFRKQLTGSEDTTAVRLWIYARIPFVLANSMAFEGDRCELCSEASRNVQSIGRHLSCSPRHRLSNISSTCPVRSFSDDDRVPNFLDPNSERQPLDEYTRPILLLHFPLYRKNELNCSTDEWDAMPEKDRATPYRPKWDCLSANATDELLQKLRPRLVLSGHSHYSCVRYHRIPGEPSSSVPEWTVASFSWRNLLNPSFLMLTVTPKEHAIEKCYLPREITIALCYCLGLFVLVFGPCLCRCCRHIRCRLCRTGSVRGKRVS